VANFVLKYHLLRSIAS